MQFKRVLACVILLACGDIYDEENCKEFYFPENGTIKNVIFVSEYDRMDIFVHNVTEEVDTEVECETNSILPKKTDRKNTVYLDMNLPSFVNCTVKMVKGETILLFEFINRDKLPRRSCTEEEVKLTTGNCRNNSCLCTIDANDRAIPQCVDSSMEGRFCNTSKLEEKRFKRQATGCKHVYDIFSEPATLPISQLHAATTTKININPWSPRLELLVIGAVGLVFVVLCGALLYGRRVSRNKKTRANQEGSESKMMEHDRLMA